MLPTTDLARAEVPAYAIGYARHVAPVVAAPRHVGQRARAVRTE